MEVVFCQAYLLSTASWPLYYYLSRGSRVLSLGSKVDHLWDVLRRGLNVNERDEVFFIGEQRSALPLPVAGVAVVAGGAVLILVVPQRDGGHQAAILFGLVRSVVLLLAASCCLFVCFCVGIVLRPVAI